MARRKFLVESVDYLIMLHSSLVLLRCHFLLTKRALHYPPPPTSRHQPSRYLISPFPLTYCPMYNLSILVMCGLFYNSSMLLLKKNMVFKQLKKQTMHVKWYWQKKTCEDTDLLIQLFNYLKRPIIEYVDYRIHQLKRRYEASFQMLKIDRRNIDTYNYIWT